MARAGSYSKSSSRVRIELIKWQFKVALQRTTSIASETLERLMIGLDEQQKWLQKVYIYGLDHTNLCRAQLTIEIDWEEYNIQSSNGHATVYIDERWKNDTAIELNEAIHTFDDFVQANNLRIEWQTSYTQRVYDNPTLYAEANRTLGLMRAEPVKWANKPEGLEMNIPEIPECKVGCYLA